MVPYPMIYTLAREREDEIRKELLREESLLGRRSLPTQHLPAQQPKLHWRWQLVTVVRHIGSHIATLSASLVKD